MNYKKINYQKYEHKQKKYLKNGLLNLYNTVWQHRLVIAGLGAVLTAEIILKLIAAETCSCKNMTRLWALPRSDAAVFNNNVLCFPVKMLGYKFCESYSPERGACHLFEMKSYLYKATNSKILGRTCVISQMPISII